MLTIRNIGIKHYNKETNLKIFNITVSEKLKHMMIYLILATLSKFFLVSSKKQNTSKLSINLKPNDHTKQTHVKK